MYVTRLRCHGQTAACCCPDESGGRLAIHLAGLPNKPDPIPGITEFLVDNGFVVLQPHYPGTHDSDGEFDPYESYRAVRLWLEGLRIGEVEDLKSEASFQCSSESFELLSCHSFGTYVGMKALRRGLKVSKAVFFAPMFGFGREAAKYGLCLDLEAHAKYVSRAFPKTFRTRDPSVISRFFSDFADPLDFTQECQHRTKCVLVAGEADPGADHAAALTAASTFISEHAPRLFLSRQIVAAGADHSVKSMLTDHVVRQLSAWLTPP